jgi:hypothetical protein
LHPVEKRPVTAVYLDHIGVAPEQVKAIVATHWHDDHVAGLSDLVNAYPGAELYVPNYFSLREGAAYVAAYSGAQAPQARGTRELYYAIESGQKRGQVFPTGMKVEVFSRGKDQLPAARVLALSPVPAAWGQAMAALLGQECVTGKQIGHAVLPKTNIASIVLHFDFGTDSVLLGSDLERHSVLGWQAVVASSFARQQRKASLFKVAHHGSETGHVDEIWSELLTAKPIATLTPYVNGSSQLPKQSDLERLRANAGAVHVTSAASSKPHMSATSERLLKAISRNLRVANRAMGHWQFRRSVEGSSGWVAAAAGAASTV